MRRTLKCAFDIPVHAERQVETVRHYSDGKFSVFMFTNGTWIFSRGDRCRADTERRLAEFDRATDFRVGEMDDGNFLVGFGEVVFSVIARDELEKLRSEISTEIEAFEQDGEQILTLPTSPRDHLYVGLLARTRLLADISNPSVLAELQASA